MGISDKGLSEEKKAGISDEDLSEEKEVAISDEDLSEEEKELSPIKNAPWTGILREPGLFEKMWNWEMLLPYRGDPDCSDYRIYCTYLEQYYGHHKSAFTEVSLVDAAEACLKKEGELVSLWDSAMKECTEEILPRSTFILSSLIQEFADKVKCPGKTFSDVYTAALLCITKEADLICTMLSAGAKPSDYTIYLSTKIRMCALSLTSHQLCHYVPAAAAMLGIIKETKKICNWMKSNNKAFNVNDKNLDNNFRLGHQVREGTLHFMTRLLEKSLFPVSAAAAAEKQPVEEKYVSGNIHRNDGNYIAPTEAANSTGGSTQVHEKVISTDSSKRMEGADKEARGQEFGSYPIGSKLSKRGGRYCNLGHGDDHGECLAEISDDIRKNQNEICADKDRMALDSLFEDLEECDDAKTVSLVGIFKFVDMFEKTWVWDRLLPLKSSTVWSDYCKYLRQYYKRNASVVAEVTGSVVALAEVFLKKEEELMSLWKTQDSCSPIEILPVITIAQSNLIQEHAHSFIFHEDGRIPVASTVALACISKEADLICELLKHGAEPTDGIIKQSIMIRMCALSLMHLPGSHAIAAAATMVGITKECKLMCDWIKKWDKVITFSIFARLEPLECHLIRARTLDVMLSILKESSFPYSKMWLDLVASKNDDGQLDAISFGGLG